MSEEAKAEVRPSETLKKYQERYGKVGHCGDEIAEVFAEVIKGDDGKVDAEKLAKVAGQNKIDMAGWAHLNIGMQRMNLGNKLRGMHKKGQTVKIGKAVIEGVPQEEAA